MNQFNHERGASMAEQSVCVVHEMWTSPEV